MDDIDFVCTVGGDGNQIMAGGYKIKKPTMNGLHIMQTGGENMHNDDDKPSIFDNLAVPAGLMHVSNSANQYVKSSSKYLHTNSHVLSDEIHDKLFNSVNGIRRGKQTKKRNTHSPLKTTKKRKN